LSQIVKNVSDIEKPYNNLLDINKKMFENQLYETLKDPDFKEDSVREEIIVPLLKGLGYKAHGEYRIVRSKTLSQPFIYVGTRKHPVNTIPDYLLLYNDKPILVLDAKSPSENILKKSHVQQAYSYAIHPEIRCHAFALCNGHHLAVFNVESDKPLLNIPIQEFHEKWEDIEKHLGPKFLLNPGLKNFSPDFGLKLKHIGVTQSTSLIMPGVRLNLYAMVNSNLFTASANCGFVGREHCASYDFTNNQLQQALACLPKELNEVFNNALSTAPFQAAAELAIELDLKVKLGEETKVEKETFVPLIVDEVLKTKFNPETIGKRADDIPPHIFKLRDAYKIQK